MSARKITVPAAAAFVVSVLGFTVLMRLGVRGALGARLTGAALTLSFLFVVGSLLTVARSIGVVDDVPLRRREGFWVLAVATLVMLPSLGSFGLIDPWETHYAEVAREMIERRDYVSPWWANEGWFMSKPVLLFWLEALSMLAFGVRTGPDRVLEAASAPEWAVRFPSFILALVTIALMYATVSRIAGRRAGLVTGLLFSTVPGFVLLSHQAITDMPLLAGITASIALTARALDTPSDERVEDHSFPIGSRSITLHAGHLMAAMVALVVVPQLCLLLSQIHVSLATGVTVEPLVAGSPHACSLPSQPPCHVEPLAHPKLTPLLEVALFAPLLIVLLLEIAGERRRARLFAIGAWLAASIAAMAKGPAGLAVPAGAVVVHLTCFRGLSRQALRDLSRLELWRGPLVPIVTIAPWYFAIYARHGRAFLDVLVMRNMLGRTLGHLHDTNAGEDTGIVYFVRQLGYATFPWSGLVLIATVAALTRGATGRRALPRSLFGAAALVSFTLVSSMQTKFHHYGLIVLPFAVGLAGMWLDEAYAILTELPWRRRRLETALAVSLGLVVSALVAADVYRTPQRFITLLTYRYDRVWPRATGFSWWSLVVGGLAASVAGLLLARTRTIRKASILTAAASAFAFSVALVTTYLPPCAQDGGQRELLLAYYRDRDARGLTSPLVAYQLNWKGENFYTGNHVAIFIASGAPFRAYLDSARRAPPDHDTVYVVTERGRLSSLRRELGGAWTVTELSSTATSFEFALVRADR